MAETTKASSQPDAEPASNSSSPSPSNAGNTDPSASSTSTSAPTPTLGGILPELKAHVLDYLPYETVKVALPMLVEASKRDRGCDDSDDSNRGGLVGPAAFHIDSVETKELKLKLMHIGAQIFECAISQMHCVNVQCVNRPPLEFLDRMIAVGWDPNTFVSGSGTWMKNEAIAKGTFDALVARGFPLKESDCIVLDEMLEPALKDLPTLSNRSMHGLAATRG